MKKIAFIIIISFALYSCTKSNFLDDKTVGLTEETVFSDSIQSINFLNRIYLDAGFSFGPSRYTGSGGSGNSELSTDNAEGVNNTVVPSDAYVQGALTPGTVNNGFATDKDYWNGPYKNIRRVNLLMSKLPVTPFAESTKKRIRGELRFLRAWYYHYLLIAFGGVPVLQDTVYGTNDVISVPRSNYADFVSYLVSELDNAVSDLKDVTYKDADYGRVTYGACLALKSRILLYAASPLFNGGSITDDPQLAALVSYPVADRNRWQLAADAAEAVINSGLYSLNVNNTTQPGYGFYQVFLRRVNSEYIFSYNRSAQKEFETFFLPPSRSGNCTMRPTLSLAEAFPMKDGKSIKESPLFNPNSPYANRDPRFDNSIIYNGMSYVTNTGTRAPVFTYMSTDAFPNSSADAYTSANKYTGFFSRKMLDENLTGSSSGTTERAWPLIRYAEILLNYAEAINEAGYPEKAYPRLIELRNRAGIQAGSDNMYGLKKGMSVDEMRAVIQNERRIELAFEDQRWNDIRRWKIASKVLSGFNTVQIITKTGADTYNYATGYSQRPLKFRDAMYLLPIPFSEVQKMPVVKQNPGY